MMLYVLFRRIWHCIGGINKSIYIYIYGWETAFSYVTMLGYYIEFHIKIYNCS
ncbi:hypothetical protein CLU79DRAFT_777290 [Phycomyces nitens]|nr:hypothetical protein CLU79DRAFT_777290 [Phycomyces nitens]